MTDIVEMLAYDVLALALAAVIVPAILVLLAAPFAVLRWVAQLVIRWRYRREWRRQERDLHPLRQRATHDPIASNELQNRLENLLAYYETTDEELAYWEDGDLVLLTELARRKYATRSELAAVSRTRHGRAEA